MKKIILIVSLIYIGITAKAENDVKIDSKITDVTVYQQSAQVSREASIKISNGLTKIVIEGMTSSYNQASIQVKGLGDFTIVDISTNIFYPSPEEVIVKEIPLRIVKSIRYLTDSIESLDWKLRKIRKNIEGLNEELSMLRASGVMKGQSKSDSIVALKEAMVYMRKMMSEINGLIIDEEFGLSKKQKELNRMNIRLTEFKNYKLKTTPPAIYEPIHQIIVTLSSTKTTSGKLLVSYLVPNAGWNAAYDLRAKDTNSPMTLVYKANVYQHTGVNWKDVDITLSTINPNTNNQKPLLSQWNLNYFVPQLYQNISKTESLSNLLISTDARTEMDKSPTEDDLYSELRKDMVVRENVTAVEFLLEMKYSVPSDNKKHLMVVSTSDIKSRYEYYVVPKLDKKTYLLAKLSNWESLNLLPAIANIYYDGTYVGKTNINPNVMNDTLSLALGTDRNIIVTRKKIDEQVDEKTFTNNVEKSMEFEIIVKNKKSFPINLIIEDQIPVSANEDIEVELLSKGKAEYNKSNGSLRWSVNLKASEQTKKEFKYSITYDKDKELAIN